MCPNANGEISSQRAGRGRRGLGVALSSPYLLVYCEYLGPAPSFKGA
jgi:hypothetical protein